VAEIFSEPQFSKQCVGRTSVRETSARLIPLEVAGGYARLAHLSASRGTSTVKRPPPSGARTKRPLDNTKWHQCHKGPGHSDQHTCVCGRDSVAVCPSVPAAGAFSRGRAHLGPAGPAPLNGLCSHPSELCGQGPREAYPTSSRVGARPH